MDLIHNVIWFLVVQRKDVGHTLKVGISKSRFNN